MCTCGGMPSSRKSGPMMKPPPMPSRPPMSPARMPNRQYTDNWRTLSVLCCCWLPFDGSTLFPVISPCASYIVTPIATGICMRPAEWTKYVLQGNLHVRRLQFFHHVVKGPYINTLIQILPAENSRPNTTRSKKQHSSANIRTKNTQKYVITEEGTRNRVGSICPHSISDITG